MGYIPQNTTYPAHWKLVTKVSTLIFVFKAAPAQVPVVVVYQLISPSPRPAANGDLKSFSQALIREAADGEASRFHGAGVQKFFSRA